VALCGLRVENKIMAHKINAKDAKDAKEIFHETNYQLPITNYNYQLPHFSISPK